MYRTIEITYTEGNRARFNLCFVEYYRAPGDVWADDVWERTEREVVNLDIGDPIYDYAEAWIKNGHIPVAPLTQRNISDERATP